MKYNTMETEDVSENISKCESVEELEEDVVMRLETQKDRWKLKINEILCENGYSTEKLGELCGVSKMSVNNWKNKGAIPRYRETFILIGMAAGYGIEELDEFIQKYGEYNGLYSKSMEDCICVFVLSKYSHKEAVEKYKYIVERMKNMIFDDDCTSRDVSTAKLDKKLADIKHEDELENFIRENGSIFSKAYHRFYAKIKLYISENMWKFGEESMSKLIEAQGWPASMKRCFSEINQNKWQPTRIKIIVLGIYLCMRKEQINELLEMTHMEPLYSKNIFESIIIFALEDAELNNIFDESTEDYHFDNLLKYTREVIEKIDSDEKKEFLMYLKEV